MGFHPPISTATGTVTSVTSANGNATVANPTTTPVITIVSTPKLQTARLIGGTSFDGTADITPGLSTTVTTNANLTGPITSSGNATSIASQTGTGTTFVMSASPTITGTATITQIVTPNNAITASGNAATVPITSRLSTVTNNSAATLTITITTTSAVDGQMVMVRILDFSAVAQTITWVNTENGSTVTTPTTSNGSTTSPLTVGFMYNSLTSKWRCIGKD